MVRFGSAGNAAIVIRYDFITSIEPNIKPKHVLLDVQHKIHGQKFVDDL
jgi:hypothetical protein